MRHRRLLRSRRARMARPRFSWPAGARRRRHQCRLQTRSEEHTSELQSRGHLVCRLLLEKKKKNKKMTKRQRLHVQIHEKEMDETRGEEAGVAGEKVGTHRRITWVSKTVVSS